MFTGIIQALGKVLEYDDGKLKISLPFRNLVLGESISVNGVCLTVAARLRRGKAAAFDVGPETCRITTLGRLKRGDEVHLERALCVGDRLGGHWVTGHVEDTGKIIRSDADGENRWVTIQVPTSLTRFMVSKGSIAVDGVSLTIASIKAAQIRLMLVPYTLEHSTLGTLPVNSRVNLEPDILAKYVLRLRSAR